MQIIESAAHTKAGFTSAVPGRRFFTRSRRGTLPMAPTRSDELRVGACMSVSTLRDSGAAGLGGGGILGTVMQVDEWG